MALAVSIFLVAIKAAAPGRGEIAPAGGFYIAAAAVLILHIQLIDMERRPSANTKTKTLIIGVHKGGQYRRADIADHLLVNSQIPVPVVRLTQIVGMLGCPIESDRVNNRLSRGAVAIPIGDLSQRIIVFRRNDEHKPIDRIGAAGRQYIIIGCNTGLRYSKPHPVIAHIGHTGIQGLFFQVIPEIGHGIGRRGTIHMVAGFHIALCLDNIPGNDHGKSGFRHIIPHHHADRYRYIARRRNRTIRHVGGRITDRACQGIHKRTALLVGGFHGCAVDGKVQLVILPDKTDGIVIRHIGCAQHHTLTGAVERRQYELLACLFEEQCPAVFGQICRRQIALSLPDIQAQLTALRQMERLQHNIAVQKIVSLRRLYRLPIGQCNGTGAVYAARHIRRITRHRFPCGGVDTQYGGNAIRGTQRNIGLPGSLAAHQRIQPTVREQIPVDHQLEMLTGLYDPQRIPVSLRNGTQFRFGLSQERNLHLVVHRSQCNADHAAIRRRRLKSGARRRFVQRNTQPVTCAGRHQLIHIQFLGVPIQFRRGRHHRAAAQSNLRIAGDKCADGRNGNGRGRFHPIEFADPDIAFSPIRGGKNDKRVRLSALTIGVNIPMLGQRAIDLQAICPIRILHKPQSIGIRLFDRRNLLPIGIENKSDSVGCIFNEKAQLAFCDIVEVPSLCRIRT